VTLLQEIKWMSHHYTDDEVHRLRIRHGSII
jgi:hypothetical protein